MYDGPVIDCDIHYLPRSEADWHRYLPAQWREFVESPGSGRTAPVTGAFISVTEQQDGVFRLDSFPQDGTPPGADYELMCEQYLDRFDVRAGLLTRAAGPTSPNGELVAATCRAWNDWLAAEWLDGRADDRLRGTLFVPTHDPVKGAAEIRRAAANPKFAAAHLFYAIGKPFGHAIYDPIYAAATEMDIPVYVHGSTGEISGDGAPPASGGTVLHYRLEMFASLHHPMAHHLTSMIVQGTFEKFPGLRIVVAEEGIAWLPWLLTQLDANYDLMKRESKWLEEQVLVPDGVQRALLMFDRATFAPSHPNPFFAEVIVRAINDWNIEQWLARDSRLFGTALVPEQVPSAAAAELRRVAEHPQIAAVTLSPSIGRLLGHPLYNPIYEAAAELGLPVVIHRGIDTMTDAPTSTAAGAPYTFAEHHTLAPLALMTNVMSLITNGVLARYPELRFYIVGGGLSWVDSMLLRIDTLWRSLRRDLPWVTEPPSTYFARQIRISFYGMESGSPETLARLLALKPHLRKLICFGSGYPSWDSLRPADVEEMFPGDWMQDVMHGNADAWFRWGGPSAPSASAPSEVAAG